MRDKSGDVERSRDFSEEEEQESRNMREGEEVSRENSEVRH